MKSLFEIHVSCLAILSVFAVGMILCGFKLYLSQNKDFCLKKPKQRLFSISDYQKCNIADILFLKKLWIKMFGKKNMDSKEMGV